MREKFPQKKLLLSAYPYFDITKEQWLKFWKEDSAQDPFQEKTILTLRPTKQLLPRSWSEAIEIENNKHNYATLTILDEIFPESLYKLPSVPAVLYLEGNENIPSAPSMLSIVGTRNPSAFGFTHAQNFSQAAAAMGFGIVSGFARGIDTIAHQAALEYGAYTLAVLGNGLQHCYPKENQKLREQILCNGGTILSQFPPSAIPFPSNFPRRNALIAALGAGTIVVEGGEKSGAIITGKLALELGLTCITLLQDYRNFGGRGAIQLLECGAMPVRNFSDALQAIALPWNGCLEPLLGKKNLPMREDRNFTLEEYAREEKLTPLEAIVAIERLILEGKIERLAMDQYRQLKIITTAMPSKKMLRGSIYGRQ